ncbi:MAG: TonB-dependent receptor [Rubrivivax sp.]|nr:TonB-dependent receptor [Pyrinomonadaceae bacterium]
MEVITESLRAGPARRTGRAGRVLGILCGLVLMTLVSPAQEVGQPSALTGTISDQNGARIAGATVTLVRRPRGSERATVTNEDGEYRFDVVPPGNYAVRVERTGFRRELNDNVKVVERAPTVTDFTLQVGTLEGVEQTVVVTASRAEETLQDVTAAVSVVTKEDLEQRSPPFVGYELTGVPSVFVRRTDEGAYTSVQIRGVPERHHNDTFIALLDGIPVVSPGDEIDLEVIPIRSVERVEVVRGPTSALYGRGSIAGAINYITRRVPEGRHADFSLTYGSYNYARPQGSFSLPLFNGNNLFVSSNYEHKTGWRDRTERNAGNLFVKDQWTINNRFALSSYLNFHAYRQSVGSHLPVRADGSIVEVTGGREANYNIDDAAYHKRVGIGAVALDTVLTPNLNLRTTAHFRAHRSRFNGGFNEGFNEAEGFIAWNGFRGDDRTSTFVIEPQLNWQRSRFRLVTGGSFERIGSYNTGDWTGEFGLNPDTFEFLFYTQKRSFRTGEFLNRNAWITERLTDANARARIFGAYAQAQVDITSRLFINAGARYDNFRRSVIYREQGAAETIEDTDNHLSPKLAVGFRIMPNLTAYGTFGEGFSPGFGPVFSFGDRNPLLKPEVARNYEAGLRGDLFARRFTFAANLYRLDRRDLILLVTDGPGTRTLNIGSHRAQGFEFESRSDLRDINEGLTGFLNYSYTDSKWGDYRFVEEFTGEAVDLTGRTVRGVPPHLLSVGVGKAFRGGTNARLWLDYASNYFVDAENRLRAGAHGLVNASLTLPFQDGRFEVGVLGTNLLNRRYFYFGGFGSDIIEAFPGQPLQIYATARYRF